MSERVNMKVLTQLFQVLLCSNPPPSVTKKDSIKKQSQCSGNNKLFIVPNKLHKFIRVSI